LRGVLAISDVVLRDVVELQRQVAAMAELVATQNTYLIRKLGRRRIPPLYDSSVVYRVDPAEWDAVADKLGGVLFFPSADEVIRRGWVDCKGAVPYRLADLRLEHPTLNFGVHTYPRRHGRDVLIHLQVLLPTGEIEDPSRLLHQ
jgi:hypothetical protein